MYVFVLEASYNQRSTFLSMTYEFRDTLPSHCRRAILYCADSASLSPVTQHGQARCKAEQAAVSGTAAQAGKYVANL